MNNFYAKGGHHYVGPDNGGPRPIGWTATNEPYIFSIKDPYPEEKKNSLIKELKENWVGCQCRLVRVCFAARPCEYSWENCVDCKVQFLFSPQCKTHSFKK